MLWQQQLQSTGWEGRDAQVLQHPAAGRGSPCPVPSYQYQSDAADWLQECRDNCAPLIVLLLIGEIEEQFVIQSLAILLLSPSSTTMGKRKNQGDIPGTAKFHQESIQTSKLPSRCLGDNNNEERTYEVLLYQHPFLPFAVRSTMHSSHQGVLPGLPNTISTIIFCPSPPLTAVYKIRRNSSCNCINAKLPSVSWPSHSILPLGASVLKVSGAREPINCQNTQSNTFHSGRLQLIYSGCSS